VLSRLQTQLTLSPLAISTQETESSLDKSAYRNMLFCQVATVRDVRTKVPFLRSKKAANRRGGKRDSANKAALSDRLGVFCQARNGIII
jgi:hypothetical protein